MDFKDLSEGMAKNISQDKPYSHKLESHPAPSLDHGSDRNDLPIQNLFNSPD